MSTGGVKPISKGGNERHLGWPDPLSGHFSCRSLVTISHEVRPEIVFPFTCKARTVRLTC